MNGPIQSALDPHGPESAGIAEIATVLALGGGAIFAVVVALTVLALVAPRPWLAGRGLVIGGGIVFPVIVLSMLLGYTLLVAPRLSERAEAEVVVELVGQQWWWRVNYLDARGETEFTTANEIHIPVGRVVEFRLRSADVLHSFWVPALAGKLDLIPGKDNRLRLAADRAGTFRGQCAEYCGGPHAQMALFVVAEDPSRFDAWRAAQRCPQPEVAGVARGRSVFLSHCIACHTVRGTRAEGRSGPDLTHFASRISLGAGLLPNRAANVAGWIGSSQHLKPGNLMPEFRTLDPDELHALVAYLGSLE
jgi:cytochrome c oxidase subunit 2